MMYIHFSAIVLFTLIVSQAESTDNPGRNLDCYPGTLKFEEFKVEFLFSSKNKSNQVLHKIDLNEVDFDPRLRTTVIVHGQGGHARDSLMIDLRNELIDWKDMNVILVNWEQGSSNPLRYPQACINTEYVAISIRSLFNHFKKTWGDTDKSVDNWGPLHFIGFSLGAHVVGQAASLLRENEHSIVDRVTGLDPAEPCFETENPLRLRSSDARFVDVIHTDGATTPNERFGLLEPIGHIDFYVNGGIIQPGCKRSREERSMDYLKLLQHSLSNGSCHHVRAFKLFVESLKQEKSKKCKFWGHPWELGKNPPKTQGIKCDSETCVEMGMNAEHYNSSEKVFYVSTTAQKPYCNVK